ncbi:MAG: DinB family protein [Chitinophagaceae bacterium]|nr:DinB family protein [Chitinophagaceae bacterium]MBL0055985.1 DinB family protein [Chitinophagaceae bacterium]
MKEVLQQYAAYNVWANQKIFDCLKNLSDGQLNKEIASSFSSVYKTVQHMWVAEEAWWKRLKLVEQIELESMTFEGNFADMVKKLTLQSAQWCDWVNGASETQLTHVFAYQNTKREQFKQPVFEMLIHVFNHGTYHRGQLVTMLRQLGVEKIPSTDFIEFSRKK